MTDGLSLVLVNVLRIGWRGYPREGTFIQPMSSSGKIVLSLWLALSSLQAVAVEPRHEVFHPRMDVARWDWDASLLVCRLRQDIPFLGRAEFETWSGGQLQFQLRSPRPPAASDGTVELWSEAPVWRPGTPSRPIGTVALSEGPVPLTVETTLSKRLLAELFRGESVRMASEAWYSAEQQSTEVGLSSVNFRAAYASYTECLANLMPVDFASLERSRIHFDSDKDEINDGALRWLRTLGDFVSRSPDVEKVFIDGHTDNTNTTTYNVDLSRRRAEAVQASLVRLGVDPERFVVRYHGERYPVRPNSTSAGKQANRRVTVRLQMQPEADLPS